VSVFTGWKKGDKTLRCPSTVFIHTAIVRLLPVTSFWTSAFVPVTYFRTSAFVPVTYVLMSAFVPIKVLKRPNHPLRRVTSFRTSSFLPVTSAKCPLSYQSLLGHVRFRASHILSHVPITPFRQGGRTPGGRARPPRLFIRECWNHHLRCGVSKPQRFKHTICTRIS